MSLMDKELHEQLCKTYLIEAEEHVASINEAILQIESTPSAFTSCLEVIYRCAHSLKGGARIVNLPLIEHICQSAESLLAKLREQNVQPEQSILATLSDVTANLLEILQSEDPASPPLKVKSETMRIRQHLDSLSVNLKTLTPKPDVENARPSLPEPILTKSAKLSVVPQDRASPAITTVHVPISEPPADTKTPYYKKSHHDTVP